MSEICSGYLVTCDKYGTDSVCCGGGSAHVVYEWAKEHYFDVDFFLKNVYPELVENRIFDLDINRNKYTVKQVRWPGHYLEYLDVDEFLSDIEDPEIRADVEKRIKGLNS
jgi:hypothetical protein